MKPISLVSVTKAKKNPIKQTGDSTNLLLLKDIFSRTYEVTNDTSWLFGKYKFCLNPNMNLLLENAN